MIEVDNVNCISWSVVCLIRLSFDSCAYCRMHYEYEAKFACATKGVLGVLIEEVSSFPSKAGLLYYGPCWVDVFP